MQIIVNYLDWDFQRVVSWRSLEAIRKHGKRVVVMEPVKGGFLADPPAPKALARMREMHPDRTPAEWVLRFAASQDGVLVVLSGMSDFAQVDENARQMADFTPLTGEEQALPGDAVREIQKAGPLHTANYSVYQDAGGRNNLVPGLMGAYNIVPETRGWAVEGAVGAVRRNVFVPMPRVDGPPAYDKRLLDACMDRADRRRCLRGELERQLSAEGCAPMLGLPAEPFRAVRVASARADKFGGVCLDGKRRHPPGSGHACECVGMGMGALRVAHRQRAGYHGLRRRAGPSDSRRRVREGRVMEADRLARGQPELESSALAQAMCFSRSTVAAFAKGTTCGRLAAACGLIKGENAAREGRAGRRAPCTGRGSRR